MTLNLTINNVASYKTPTSLEIEKPVNLIYGLNGAGKTVLSNYLYDLNNPDYRDCRFDGLQDEEVVVYNQRFIDDYFYETDNLKGIFTLSKKNVDAEKKIKAENARLKCLADERRQIDADLQSADENLMHRKELAENNTWDIKRKFAGGDRVLEFCLEGLKGRKEALFDHLSSIPYPKTPPPRSIDELKRDAEVVRSEGAQPIDEIKPFQFPVKDIEQDPVFEQVIVGNEQSQVAELIRQLGNADWVRKGLEFLPADIEGESERCPFCQERTVSEALLSKIRDHFDDTYKEKVSVLSTHFQRYISAVDALPSLDALVQTELAKPYEHQLKDSYEKVLLELRSNAEKIRKKQQEPSLKVTLQSTSQPIEEFNNVLKAINSAIAAHNNRLENKAQVSMELSEEFWRILRVEYDQTISMFKEESRTSQSIKKQLVERKRVLQKEILGAEKKVKEYQRETVNIESAIRSINSKLIDIGITDFHVSKHEGNFYRIHRIGDKEEAFRTLSEGEKMIISFLYFIERCKGRASEGDIGRDKVVVIDDPISSLSHLFVFNIAELIKAEFFRSGNYPIVIVLTHSLYFFYEVADDVHDRRKENQGLFRVVKTSTGSQILPMKYNEIQNDYQSYWQIVKDEKQHPALIANCMRNIVEYFFGFIEKRALNDVFQKPELQENQFQAFRRYMGRESHSFGQNLFDHKEFDYQVFRDGLRLIFEKCNYHEHYKKMIS